MMRKRTRINELHAILYICNDRKTKQNKIEKERERGENKIEKNIINQSDLNNTQRNEPIVYVLAIDEFIQKRTQ